MIIHTTAENKHEITQTSYTRKVWKHNHVAFGHQTNGCWNTVHCGKRDHLHANSLSKAIIHGSGIIGLEMSEFRVVFEATDAANITLYIEGSELRLYADSKWHTFNKKNRPEFQALAKKKGWLLSEKVRREKDQVARASARLVTSSVKAAKTPEALKQARENAFVVVTSAMRNGIKEHQIELFHAWEKKNTALLSGVKMPQRAQLFLASAEVEPRLQRVPSLPQSKYEDYKAWEERLKPQFKNRVLPERIAAFMSDNWSDDWFEAEEEEKPEIVTVTVDPRGELAFRDAAERSAFKRWLKTHTGKDSNLPHTVLLEIFRDGSHPKDWKFEVVETSEAVKPAKPAPIFDDAHVMAYRRQRANRLKALRRVAAREGQGLFRLHVLANFGGVCCISGIDTDVEAAHIVPHAYTAYQHAENGLPLAKFLHSAFDTGLFTIHPETLIVIVAKHARQWLNIHDHQLRDGSIWPIDRSALAHHYELFTEKHAF
ncbi:HNH endonuclease [Klebsiella michiganensis]|uniref:HNH endonuclease n=1 Tax=Klebsiella TaxID=570 RepID=UPI00141C810D|nr:MULTISPECIES: HNH endonuclease signature motif containing protein [Klebsiella]MBS6909415.1 HNH endonuclease [Klebsiella sp.]MDM4109752.1 HNH endonuclease signature motif containing protein [Klebsiella michiganensis]MDM4342458.1 HNH endonuclease signature motif containing protein [Klebsiella michiganensis]MDM4348971.1 HNH endonuclease signature motif containing protein [Klebsiella michiganensis]MEE1964954.1 HNH endonuclease signature motif containing protein [Klebsiella michiganensis]